MSLYSVTGGHVHSIIYCLTLNSTALFKTNLSTEEYNNNTLGFFKMKIQRLLNVLMAMRAVRLNHAYFAGGKGRKKT